MTPTPRPLEVELLSYPINPLGTIWNVWEQSRTNGEIPSPAEVEKILADDSHPDNKKMWETINQVMDEDIPCTESINFVFVIRNMSISLREQMVRHRVGTKVGENFGVDVIPEFNSSSWWSQTMRMLPMDKFYREGRFIMPESLEGKKTRDLQSCENAYLTLLREIETVYGKLIEAGVPLEDARQIIPVAVTHGATWTLNLKAMRHIVGKRACWVMQASLWEKLISGMVDELCEKIHPMFRKMILPPCFKKGVFASCPYHTINGERIQGRDNNPPCPLYVYHQEAEALKACDDSVKETGKEATWQYPKDGVTDWNNIENWTSSSETEKQLLIDNIIRFERLWKIPINPAVAR